MSAFFVALETGGSFGPLTLAKAPNTKNHTIDVKKLPFKARYKTT